jgi:carboxylate-amine ligase
MMASKPAFTIGIEEEYLLVDRQTRDVVSDPPQEIFELCESRVDRSRVDHELLRSQIEVDTRVCENVRAAVEDLERLRRLTIDVAGRYGLAPIAASTHPPGFICSKPICSPCHGASSFVECTCTWASATTTCASN